MKVLGLTWDAVGPTADELVIDQELQRVRRALPHRETKAESSDAFLRLC